MKKQALISIIIVLIVICPQLLSGQIMPPPIPPPPPPGLPIDEGIIVLIMGAIIFGIQKSIRK